MMLSTTDFSSFSPITISAAIIILLVTAYTYWASAEYEFSSNAPKRLREGWPIFGVQRFFSARWDLFQHGRAQSPSGNFSFFVGKHPVIGLTGDKARQAFFSSRDLGFAEGYAVLFGQSPNQVKILEDEDPNFISAGGFFVRRMTHMISSANFGRNLPKLIQDIHFHLDELDMGPSNITDPFTSIWLIVYQLTMRMVGSDDIANDPALLARTLEYYEAIDGSATPTAIMFPWFPSPAVIKRTYAGSRLYMLINNIVEKRKKTGIRGDDPLQYLIDQGDSMFRIIEFIIGALFAGLLNSGINAAWILTYLAASPNWQSRVLDEVKQVAAKYNPSSTLPLLEQLDNIPCTAWETEFPLIDLCLKDSIRLQALGTAFRKNISGKKISTGTEGEVIDPGAIVTYHLADVHLDESIYPDPKKWDPERYMPERAEDKKKPWAYLGWGVGRHPCIGMRFAKLENNLLIAYFTAKYEYELVDAKGNPTFETPEVDFNGRSAMKPHVRPWIRFERR